MRLLKTVFSGDGVRFQAYCVVQRQDRSSWSLWNPSGSHGSWFVDQQVSIPKRQLIAQNLTQPLSTRKTDVIVCCSSVWACLVCRVRDRVLTLHRRWRAVVTPNSCRLQKIFHRNGNETRRGVTIPCKGVIKMQLYLLAPIIRWK